jgi:diguanylate cyclase (GGDEF)-like protein
MTQTELVDEPSPRLAPLVPLRPAARWTLAPADGGASGDARVSSLERELELARAAIQRMAEHIDVDPLTGLYNQHAIRRCVELEVARARRHERDLAVLLVDVDRLGAINDVKGWSAGDEVLRALALGICGATRATDIQGRLGSDEFVVVCPETDPSGAVRVAEKLVSKVAGRTLVVAGRTVHLSICVGVVPVCPGMTAADVLDGAGVALARAKGAGGSRWAL